MKKWMKSNFYACTASTFCLIVATHSQSVSGQSIEHARIGQVQTVGRPSIDKVQSIAQSPMIADARADGDSQNAVGKAVDELVIRELTEQNVPGYALAVIKDGNLIVHRGYGVADLQTKQPVTPQTVFGLASLTKTFTALALLTLVDQGKVGLDDTLDMYVSNLTKPYQKLTIRQLASMTAGVPKQISQEVEWKNQLSILEESPLVSDPGTAFLYSNFSYRLLGDVIQKAAGKPYFEVVKERIFTPLQMTSSGTTVDLASTGLLAQAYGDNNGKAQIHPVEYKNPHISFSAGMLASTIDDLIKYTHALMGKQLLSAAAYKTLWYQRPNLPNGNQAPWAFGWSSKDDPKYGGARVISMNGGTPGVASTIILLPEKNGAVIALCSLRKPPVYTIARKVAALVFGGTPTDGAPQTMPEQEPSGE
jgi:CubicO group peptidase (beta-lactamase class C family)